MLLVASTIFCDDTLKQTNRQNLSFFWISSHCVRYNHQVLSVMSSMSLVGWGSQNKPLTAKAPLAPEINQNLQGCSAIIKDFSPVPLLVPNICPPYNAVL